MSGPRSLSVAADRFTVKRVLLGSLIAAIVVWTALVVTRIVRLDYDSWMTGRRVSTVLRDARAVTLIEFSAQVVIAKKEATPEDIVRLRQATRRWYLPFVSYKAFLCNEPHHTIVISDVKGDNTSVDICFLCEKFGIPDEGLGGAALPPQLKNSLEMFFTSVGMKPKTWIEYSDIAEAANKQAGSAP